MESELFGREKGAYTGAATRQVGRFEFADGSTIFLDEVGDLSLDMQVKLLRVLERGEFERLGSSRTIRVDVRVIAATNRNLEQAIKRGEFRMDLYYRLDVFPITVPPLRERREDIPLLTWRFVKEFTARQGKQIESISSGTMRMLKDYSWPGNVRELRNIIERAVILADGPALHINLPAVRMAFGAGGITLEEVERHHIHSVLERTGWRVSGPGGAAEVLGMKPTTLGSRMKKLKIERSRSKKFPDSEMS